MIDKENSLGFTDISPFIPGLELMGGRVDVTGLPKLFNSPSHNKIAWTTLGNTATLAASLIGIKLLANSLAKDKIEKARERSHSNKVNSLYAYSTPNTAPQVAAVDKVRSLGVTKQSSGLSMALPLVLSVPAALALSSLVNSRLESDATEEADEKLAKARNELDALQAKLIKLKMKKVSSMEELPDAAKIFNSSVETAPVTDEHDKTTEKLPKQANGTMSYITGVYMLAAALAAGLTGATVYNMTKGGDNERKKQKLLEKQVFAQNLTNAPTQVELLLGKHKAFPTDESGQTYIKEIARATN